MTKTIASALLVALTALTIYTPIASAREGSARSIGNGIKCRNVAVTVNGVVTVKRVCSKGL